MKAILIPSQAQPKFGSRHRRLYLLSDLDLDFDEEQIIANWKVPKGGHDTEKETGEREIKTPRAKTYFPSLPCTGYGDTEKVNAWF